MEDMNYHFTPSRSTSERRYNYDNYDKLIPCSEFTTLGLDFTTFNSIQCHVCVDILPHIVLFNYYSDAILQYCNDSGGTAEGKEESLAGW